MTTVNASVSIAQCDGRYAQLDVIQTNTPATGNTVSMNDNALNGTLYLTPAGTLATLTVTLPTNLNSVIGQIRRIATNNALTILTINGAGTILGNIATLALGASVAFQKVASDTWVRLT